MESKKYPNQGIIGERGITLIKSIVLEMGCLWHPTNLDAGIDGFIEIRDPKTQVATNLILQVQSKATDGSFSNENEKGFDFYCDERDLRYWLSGNAPVLVIASKPSKNEAYWIPVKDYFLEAANLESRKIHFDKEKDRFSKDSYDCILKIAKPKEAGIFLNPLPRKEILVSNLLELRAFPDKIYFAETKIRKGKDIWDKLHTCKKTFLGAWVLKDGNIWSFFDLCQEPFDSVCASKDVKIFSVCEWSQTQEPETKKRFVELLNSSLKNQLGWEIKWNKQHAFLYFGPSKDLQPKTFSYNHLEKRTTRTVFQGYQNKRNPSEILYYRHSAFISKFVRIEEKWFLSILPTYHFTSNGIDEYRFAEDQKKGIKRLEWNSAVLGQVIMWAEYIQKGKTLFNQERMILVFGDLLKMELPVGISDKLWIGQEDPEQESLLKKVENQTLLFNENEI